MSAPAKGPPDPVFDTIGHAGMWQIRILLLMCLSKFPIGWLQLSTVFLAPPIKFHCVDPDNKTNPCSSACKKYEYDRSIFKQTAIMEWDLVCDKKHYAEYGQTIFMLGILLGNVIFGILSDKKGRRIPLLVGVVMQAACGVGASISPFYWLFVFLRFLSAVATGGTMLIGFCILMEIIGPKRREVLCGIAYQLPFNFGHCLLPVFAYFIRHFRWYQFALSIYSVVLFSYFCLVPESPRWLMIAGRVEESIKIVERAAVVNKMPVEAVRPAIEEAARVHQATSKNAPKGNIADLLRTPNLRRNSLCIFFNWFAWGFNYFGVSQYVGLLSGNMFLNVFMSAMFGLPGVLISAPACKYLGRKKALYIGHGIACICMFLFVMTPTSLATLRVILTCLAVFGSSLVYPSVYIFAAELFPTMARNAGMGVCSMLARIGAMVTANVTHLEQFGVWLPPVIFACMSFAGICLVCVIPETKGESLPETIEEAENLGKKKN